MLSLHDALPIAHVALLLLVQAVGQLQQLLEQLLDVAAADVVALDQRLELLGTIGARAVQAYPRGQSGADRGLQRPQETGRAAGRGRGCQEVESTVSGGSCKKNRKSNTIT